MLKVLFLNCCICLSLLVGANTIIVKNADELTKANKEAKPGDIVILQNGEWNNISIVLNCKGTKAQPITFKAQNSGNVIITGNSKLTIGGEYIVVDGLYFTRGFAGDDAIISFRTSKKELANNCRITNTVINDFNNPKRLDENYWVEFYGKHNQIDHCSFMNKKNMGVMMAVILDDERSRENFHSIDHNYFGFRLPLASNTGETIRVGVSQHCEFNSNTQITDNFFEHCDGETEIISIKSGSNVIKNNLFKECQGSVVMRHGNFNTVENNVFLGNNKEGTGGVRIINKGQWVVNNLFYQCRGTWFRSPIAIMNGVPNSPANRYVEVTDAVVANNSFYECTPVSLCVGSDEERSVAPSNVFFLNNIFYNTKDSLVYFKYDDINRIQFASNIVSNNIAQNTRAGFIKSDINLTKKTDLLFLPIGNKNQSNKISDSLLKISQTRLTSKLSEIPGLADDSHYKQVISSAYSNTGANWFSKNAATKDQGAVKVKCKSSKDIYEALEKYNSKNISLILTRRSYHFNQAVNISTDTKITSKKNKSITFSSDMTLSPSLFQIIAGNNFTMEIVKLDLKDIKTNSFISTDTSGSSNHSNIIISNTSIQNLTGNFFTAAKTSVADKITISNNSFSNNQGILFNFNNEIDKKGYYNVEKLLINNNSISNHKGQILGMLRTGNDESTMGPDLSFINNKIANCSTANGEALIHLYGTQISLLENNSFNNSNTSKTLIRYEDIVRSVHRLKNNLFTTSGKNELNEFVENKDNVAK